MTVASPIASQLRAVFITQFLQNIVLSSNTPIKQCKQTCVIIVIITLFLLRVVLKNSISKFLLTAFVHERIAGTWPEAIGNLLSCLTDSAVGREIFLKFCLILTEEIASCNANLVKSEVLSKRNADLRDSMRNGDNALLCKFWRQVLQTGSGDSGSEAQLVVLALECLAAYSSWIDVGLVVEGETLKLIYFLLQSNNPQIQMAAADCLGEIVLKGMSAGDKISLASYMNLVSVFEAVGARGVIDTFFSKICRVLNNLGYSLGQQITLASPQSLVEVQTQVVQYTGPVLLPHLLQFLRLLTRQARANRIGNECWQISLNSLLPFIASFFEIARSMRDSLRPDQNEFMSQFLPLCCDLLQLSDSEALEEETDEEFNETRLALFQAFDSVLWLQGHATIAFLNGLKNNEAALTVGRCELLARLVLRVPEGMRGAPTFTISINGNNRMTPISELVTWVNETIPERFPALLFLVSDVLVRYSSTAYLDVFSDRIDSGLGSLMRLAELRGFKEADCEKLMKFVKNLKGKLGGYSIVLLTSLQGPLNNRAVMSRALYEVAGQAVASLDGRTVQLDVITGELLKTVLDASMREESKLAALDCLAAFAKGFMSDSCLDPGPIRSWFCEYCSGFLINRISGVGASLEYFAVLINFAQRMIPLLQGDSIPLIVELSHVIISYSGEGSVELMSQLLPLLSAALFKLRDQFANQGVLGVLWPQLITQIYARLTCSIHGTDDFLNHLALCRATVSLLHAMGSSPVAVTCTLAQQHPLIEPILLRVAEIDGVGGTSGDVVGLLRSLCGVVNKCHVFVSRDFINFRLIPCLLGASIPAVFRSLDASSRKSAASIPAAVVNLLQDFVSMLRVLQGAGIVGERIALKEGIECDINGDLKEIRMKLVEYFVHLE